MGTELKEIVKELVNVRMKMSDAEEEATTTAEAEALDTAWDLVSDAIAELQKVAKGTKPRVINCTNYFNEIGCGRLREALEAGELVEIYIDCIGHTRAFCEGNAYREWLKEEYGERLETVTGYSCTGDCYRLKN